MRIEIVTAVSSPAARFAAAELKRYLTKAAIRPVRIVAARRPDGDALTLRLGLFRQAGCGPDDDAIRIAPEPGGYFIGGTNPRSVLFAAYRFLRELGFRWIRPGDRGEIVPTLKGPLPRHIRVSERASYPYRTVCIEGAASERHVLDLIAWMAKQGMNGYFVQFQFATEFWQRWYHHKSNPLMKAERCDERRARRIVDRVAAELRRREMRFERVGHGWTCAALGMPGEGWAARRMPVPARRKSWLALVRGRRQFHYGVPLNTNLCYSNPAVRKAVTSAIVDYAAAHPEVDIVHFWLADGSNNNCECRGCRRIRPADFYVDMLNELDARLTAAGVKTRIVFLIYVDLLWPPIRRRIRNPNRFILMFAPITRSYLQSFLQGARQRARMRPYTRNHLVFPRGAAENLAYLRAWQKVFKGEGFDFDYHLIWTCYQDLAMYNLSRVLHADIRGLRDIGLHGFNSCQNQRQSFPHNLPMDIMARTLWNRNARFRDLAREYFADAYGPEWRKAASFFERMSALGQPFYEGVHHPQPDRARIAEGLRNVARMERLAAQMRPLAERQAGRTRGAVRWSWKYLLAYLDLLRRLLPAYAAYLRADPDCRRQFERVFDLMRRQERTLHPALDTDTCLRVLERYPREVERMLKKAAH